MSITVCLAPTNTLNVWEVNPNGGHFWAYLNWALGLRALGCEVIWLETVDTIAPEHQLSDRVARLKRRLEPYGLGECVALRSDSGVVLSTQALGCLDFEAAAEADLLLNQRYSTPSQVVRRFRRSALLDIDPGLLQWWMVTNRVPVAPHDIYFSIGELVNCPGQRVPDLGLTWHHTPPCVALDWWQPQPPRPKAPFTTVSNWWGHWVEEASGLISDEKRDAFRPFLDLPRRVTCSLELALALEDLPGEAAERELLLYHGWHVQKASEVAANPWDFQRYVQASRGEFSCAKPSYVRYENAWLSDRTVCYLASGKPAVVQHTGSSQFLPDADGLFRFRDIGEAVRYLEIAAADYERHCQLARKLAEEYFDARLVVGRLLERALA
jgi:hypothetical protein